MNYLLGTYAIEGINQDEERSTYQGTLELTSYNNKGISAKWKIEGEQEQFGQGYLKKDKLIIDFYYYDEFLTKCKGQVTYTFIDNTVLSGVWTEENGDKNYLGKENCFRIDNTILC